MNSNSYSLENFGALSHLVEVASAMTELEVKPCISSNQALRTALVSDDDEMSRVTTEASTETTTELTSNPAKKKEIFPQKLMEILSNANDNDSEIISWLPHGQSFVIIRPDLFCEQVLPRYSVSTKYPSFTRKLNRWGFRQAIRGSDTGAFHHPFFRRDQPELCANMVCQKSRDRYGLQKQQQYQQQRSLPPKKRAIPNIAAATASPTTVTPVTRSFAPITASNAVQITNGSASDALVQATSIYNKLKYAKAPVHVSSDDNSSITSNASATTLSSAGVQNLHGSSNIINNLAQAATIKIKPNTGMSPTKTNAPVATVTATTGSTTFSKNQPLTTMNSVGGVMRFISNDAEFVAATLRQREILEIARAAKAMLYESYIRAMNEHTNAK